jgi:aspartate aminotransferase-like enzyme
MFRLGPYLFKFAETESEFEQVHALNYRTFVQEIPQHHDTGTGQLVDKYHDKNRYIIAIKEEQVVGMVCVHDQQPFSVAARMPDPSLLSRPDIKPLEVRLLAVDPAERTGLVPLGIVWCMYLDALELGYTHLFISGVLDQQALYKRIGFEPLGPAVGSGTATFIPMWVPVPRIAETMGRLIRLLYSRAKLGEEAAPIPSSVIEPVCLLPGPVAIAPVVREAFHAPLIYHRGEEFIPLFERVRTRLSALVGGKKVAILVGSGTLANDAVGATLAAEPQRGNGLVLVNGEFGGRLLKQARRFGLAPRVLTWDWGQPWDLSAIEQQFQTIPAGGWVWGVHHETSTGLLNDLSGLVELAKRYRVRVCLDCVSSIGAVPLDLSGVYLASAASGKALGSYAGLAFVFADPADLAHLQPESISTYLDVPATLATTGPRFTIPSPLVSALDVALEAFASAASRAVRFRRVARLGTHLRAQLRELGLTLLTPDAHASPAVVTFAPPESADAFVQRCRRAGFLIAGQSGYLAERGLVQIAVMGNVQQEQIDALIAKLAGRTRRMSDGTI